MSDFEINVVSRTQTIIIEPTSGCVSVINAGPQGAGISVPGPPGEPGEPGAPGPATGIPPQVDVYGTPGDYTWTKPTGAILVEIFAVGGGGEGGGGRRGATNTSRQPGGGARGGGISFGKFRASDLPATLEVRVGAGAVSDGPTTTDNSNGTSGNGGGDTIIGDISDFTGGNGTLVAARGGQWGDGGLNAAGTNAANAGGEAMFEGGAGGGSTGGATQPLTPESMYSPAGGGAGGGITNTNILSTPTSGGRVYAWAQVPQSNAGSNPGVDGTNGMNQFQDSVRTYNSKVPCIGGNGGGGGGAGDAAGTIPGGKGGDGGFPGGGGGGGGASTNGVNSGAGGNGGNGIVVITTWKT